MLTVYIVQAFTAATTSNSSRLIADTPITCTTAQEAINRAERLKDKRVGVVAIAQEYDADSDEFGKVTILASYGTLPEQLFGDD